MSDAHELRIRIDRAGEHSYRVSATGPAGDYDGTFALPFDERDLKLLIANMSLARGRVATRRIESSDRQVMTEFGGKLFKALFAGPIDVAYRVSRDHAHHAGESLRLTLALTDAPELMNLPWEYLYDDPDFVAMSMSTPLVRHLEAPKRYEPLKVELPLRILAMVSLPTNVVQLDVNQERENLERALAGLIDRGAVEIEWLEEATLQALLRKLQGGPFHVFHYIGHGAYDSRAGDGVLLLEDPGNRARHVTGRDLGVYLAQHASLRLAVINACEGARTADDDPFAGVATSLVRRGLPAVVAMQFEITDAAAVTFASEFYWKLADCGLVDTALAYTRLAIFANNEIEWATPVLFMRTAEGRIFDVPEERLDRPPQPEPVPPRRRRTLLAIGGLVLAAAAAALAFFLLNDSSPTPAPKGGKKTVVQPPPPPPPPSPQPWSLLTALPAEVRAACPASAALQVPGALKPKVQTGTVEFTSAFVCERPVEGIVRVQYSVARSELDLNRFFNWRANGAHLAAFAVEGLCGSTLNALNYWRPAGATGHDVVTAGQGVGRVVCYERNGLSRIEWTDRRRLVYGFLEGPDRATAHSWWATAAGPDASA